MTPEHNPDGGAVGTGLLLGFDVSRENRVKIWNNKYVELVDLLYPDQNSTVQFALNAQSLVQVVTNKRELQSLKDWIRGFDAFIAIYSENPNKLSDISALLAYKAGFNVQESSCVSPTSYSLGYLHTYVKG